MTHAKDVSNIPLSLTVFLAVGAYSLLVGTTLQLWILPHWLPELHAGAGMIAGTDWSGFHQLAVAQAQTIQMQGWSGWTLRPEQQAPAGIASAIYYLTDIWQPFAVLPLQCTLFALSAAAIHRILCITISGRWATLGILPLIFFPSSAQLYAQLSKDIWSLTGWTLLFSTMLSALHPPTNWKQAITPSFTLYFALLMLWIPRPYNVPLAISIWSAVGVFLLAILLSRKMLSTPHATKWSASIILLAITQLGWWQFSTQSNLIPETLKPSSVLIEKKDQPLSQANLPSKNAAAQISTQNANRNSEPTSNSSSTSTQETAGELSDQNVRISTTALDHYIQRIDRIRQGFLTTYPLSGSMIDEHVRFETVSDALKYLPRAIQIGWMAPFPNTWAEQGMQPGSRWMRAMAATEMSLAYILMATTGLILITHRGRYRWNAALIGVLLSCATLILVQTYAIPNVGTLYRMRLPMWHIFLGVGIVFAAQMTLNKSTVTGQSGARQ